MGFRFRHLNIVNLRWNSYPRGGRSAVYAIPRRWSHGGEEDYGKEGERIFKLGFAADIALASGKAFTGYLSGSTAIIADAAHSVSDVVALRWCHLRLPRRREIKNTHMVTVDFVPTRCYSVLLNLDCFASAAFVTIVCLFFLCLWISGHGKFETLGALSISCMLLGTAGGIGCHALDILMGLYAANPEVLNQSLTDHVHQNSGHHHGVDMEHPSLALSMTILSIGVKEGLYWITKKAGEKQGSGLMKEMHGNAISSVVALVGVGGSILGVKFLDPLAELFVSGMILKAGIETGYQSVLELVDAAIPTRELDPIRQTIFQVEGMKGCHRLRGRRAGSSLYLDVHIEVDPFCSVSAAHDIGEKVRHQIHKTHPGFSEVFIHIDPALPVISPNVADPKEFTRQCGSPTVEETDIDAAVSSIISTKFAEMVVERVTHHLLGGKKFLQIQVSMPPDILIRDAMEMAKEAEVEISKVESSIMHVSSQPSLGSPIPQFIHD